MTRQALSPEQLERLGRDRPLAVLATADRHGRPHCAVVSWLVAPGPRRLLVALDHRGRHLRNIAHNPKVAVQVLGDDLLFVVTGSARVARDRLEAAPFASAAVVIEVESVVDQSVSGVWLRGPSYQFATEKSHRHAVEERVRGELATVSTPYLPPPVSLVDDREPAVDD